MVLVGIATGLNRTTSSTDRVIMVNVTMVKCCLSPMVLGVGVISLCAIVLNLKKRSATLLLVGYMGVGDILFGLLPWADLAELVLQTDGKNNDNFNDNIFLTWIGLIGMHWQFQAAMFLALERFCFIAKFSVHRKYFTTDKIPGLLGSALSYIMLLETTKTLKVAHSGGRNESIFWGTFPMYILYTLVVIACYAGLMQNLLRKRNNLTNARKVSFGKRSKLRLYNREIKSTLRTGSMLCTVLLGNIFCAMPQIYISSSPNHILILSCIVFFVNPISRVVQIYQIPTVRKMTVKICVKTEGDANKSVATQVRKKETIVQMVKETSSTIVHLYQSKKEESSTEQETSFMQKFISLHDTVGYLVKLFDLF